MAEADRPAGNSNAATEEQRRRAETAAAVEKASGTGRLSEEAGEKMRQIGQQSQESILRLRRQSEERYDQLRKGSEEALKSLESYVKEEPVKAIGVAAGVGVLLGLLFSRR